MRTRVEIWDRANTKRRAVLSSVTAAAVRRAIGREETLQLEGSAADAALSALGRSAVLRLQTEGSATDFSAWRLARSTEARGDDGRHTYRLEADALWMDLRHGRVRQEQADGTVVFVFGLVGLTPVQWLQDILLPGYDGDAAGFSVGTVELTDPIDLTWGEPISPLEGLRMLEQAAGGELQWRLQPDGRTYLVDLVDRVGGAEGGAELRYGKNLRGLERIEDDTEPVSRLYAQGAGLLTLADAEWPITGVAGGVGARVLSFQRSPVFEDGAFVGLYARIGAASYLITASDATAGTITVDEAAHPVPVIGGVAQLHTDAAGTRLSYLESPSAVAALGVRVGDLEDGSDIPDASNLVLNGDLADWAAGMPEHWSKLGAPVVAELADAMYAKHGGKAAHVQAAAEGEGLISDAVTIPSSERRPYLGMLAGLTVVSGRIRLELRHSNGNTYPLEERPGSEGLEVYLSITAGPVHEEPLPPGTAQVAIVAHGGAAEWYLDVAMATLQVSSEVPDFVRDSGAWLLWDRAAAELAERTQPKREYRIDVADLHSIDPARFAFDELRLGDDVKVRDPDFGNETLRIVELSQDVLQPEAATLGVAPGPWKRPLREAGDLARPHYSPRRPHFDRAAGAGEVRVLSVGEQFDEVTEELFLSALGSPRVGTLELYVKATRTGAYPGAPAATINGREGTFPGIAVGPDEAVFWRVLAKDGRGVAGGSLEGSYSRLQGSPPILDPRRELNTDGTTADVHVRVESKAGETIRLAVKESEAAGAPVWRLVVGAADATPLWVASGAEINGSTAWFHDGSTFAQKLKGISLLRDQLRRVYLQAEAFDTALKSTWIPLAIEIRAQPWLEGVDLVWDETADTLALTATGGAHSQSGRWELSDDEFATIAQTIDLALADGQRVTWARTLAQLGGASARGTVWQGRVVPFNGALSGGVCTGLAGVPAADSEEIPASEGGVQAPTAAIEQTASSTVSATYELSGTLGAGGSDPLEWQVLEDDSRAALDWPAIWETTALPATHVVTRHWKRPKTLHFRVRDAEGRISEPVSRGVDPIMEAIGDDDGRLDPVIPFHRPPGEPTDYPEGRRRGAGRAGTVQRGGREGDERSGFGGPPGALVNTTSLRDSANLQDLVRTDTRRTANMTLDETMVEHAGRAVNRLYAKPIAADPDHFDSIAEGLTHGKTRLTALTGGEVDLSKAGVLGKHGGNIQRTGANATKLDAILGHVADTGHAASTMQESGGKPINRLFAKGLAADPDHADSINPGVSKRVTTNDEATGGGRGFGGFTNATGALVSSSVESGGKAVNRLFAKPLPADPDTADSVGAGALKRVTTLNEATGAGYAHGTHKGTGGLKSGITIEDAGADRPLENTHGSQRKAARKAGAAQRGGREGDERSGFGGPPGELINAAPVTDAAGINTLLDTATRKLTSSTILDEPTGTLGQSAKASDGTSGKLLPKGVKKGSARNGESIVFEDTYNSPPEVIFTGGASDQEAAVWGTVGEADANGGNGTATGNGRPSGGLIAQLMGADVTTTGFIARLRLTAKGAPAAKSTTYGTPTTITALGGTTGDATPPDADTPSADDKYAAGFRVTCSGAGTSDEDVHVEVALDAQLNAGAWAEVGTKYLVITAPAGGAAASVTSSITALVNGVDGGNDNFRLRIKTVFTSGSADFDSLDQPTLSWFFDSGAKYASMTPNGSADAVPYVLMGAA